MMKGRLAYKKATRDYVGQRMPTIWERIGQWIITHLLGGK